jgi:hypothetical protein
VGDDGGWGVSYGGGPSDDGGGVAGDNWGMCGVSGGEDWGMGSVAGDERGMGSIAGDEWGMGSIAGDEWGMGVAGDYWSMGSVGGHDGGGVSDGHWSVEESIVGDAGVEFTDAGEGTVYGFGVMRDGLVATEGTDNTLVGGADGWGVDGVGGGMSHGHWTGVSQDGGGLVDVSGADGGSGGVGHSGGGGVSGHGRGTQKSGVGVSQSGGEDDELKLRRFKHFQDFFKFSGLCRVGGAEDSL